MKRLLLLILVFQLNHSLAFNIDKDVFSERRARFMEKIGNAIVIMKGESLKKRNSDVNYKFRQSSDFFYLTGFEEPDAAFLLVPEGEKQYILFIRETMFWEKLFMGTQLSTDEIMEKYVADTVYSMNSVDDVVIDNLVGREKFYYKGKKEETDDRIRTILKEEFELEDSLILDPGDLIHEMRLIKEPYEIGKLQKAVNITCKAHVEAMKAIEPGMNEYEVESIIYYIYGKNGAQRWGFPSIVASGKNSTILHYEKNNSPTKDGDLIMVDIGAEYDYYSADVTRTFPVNGKFSPEQKDIYEVALAATDASTNLIKPGVGFKEIHKKAIEIINNGLYELGLITNKKSRWQYKVWLSYWSLHWLGMDPHDVGSPNWRDPKGRILEPGMVLAIEPGIYINSDLFENLPNLRTLMLRNVTDEELLEFMNIVRPSVKKYSNICCRVEDNVLVTEDGVEVLSLLAPRKITDIEELMEQGSIFKPNSTVE
ncbi:aminopeptidase P N-terminal domain-containing protein [Bacteroidota bacterium]